MFMEANAKKSKQKQYSDYELKDMADTLQKAHEIQADPELMKLLAPMLDKKSKAVKSIDDLRKKGREMSMDNESKEDPKEEASESPDEENAEG